MSLFDQSAKVESALADFKLAALERKAEAVKAERLARRRIILLILVCVLSSPLTFLGLTFGSNSVASWMLSIAETASMRKR